MNWGENNGEKFLFQERRTNECDEKRTAKTRKMCKIICERRGTHTYKHIYEKFFLIVLLNIFISNKKKFTIYNFKRHKK